MKRRPLGLSLYLGIMWVLAISFPVQICVMQELSIFNVGAWWTQLTWLNLMVMALMLISGYLAFTASNRILVFAPLTFLFVAVNNWWVGSVGLNFSFIETTTATFAFALTSAPLFFGNAYAAILNKNIHWWRMAKRRRASIPIVMHPWVGDSFVATSFDISETGVFVQLKDEGQINVGDLMQMRLNISGHIDIRCTGRAVRKSAATGTYPRGVGVVFEDLSPQSRKVLRGLSLG